MAPRLQLPPNPSEITTLSDREGARVDAANMTSWKRPEKGCKTCQDRRWFKTPANRKEPFNEHSELVEYDCDCKAQWVLHRFLLASGIGYRYQTRSWDDLHGAPVAAMDQVYSYVENDSAIFSSGHGMTLWSQSTGTGKTLAAVMTLKVMLGLGKSGYFVQFNDLLDHSTDGWRDVEERKWFNRRIRNTELLVIDDIGRENPGRANVVEAMLDSVIRSRVAAGRPTIITTNRTPDQMQVGYGHNILSLLSEVNIQIDFSGQDYRPRHQRQAALEMKYGVTYPLCVY